MLDLHSLLTGLKTLFKTPTYGGTIEEYIVSKNPQTSADIDRLTIEWQRGQTREKLL